MNIKQVKIKEITKFQKMCGVAHNMRRHIRWAIYDRYSRIRDFIFPRNRWASKVIPNHWSDKTYLIPKFLFAAIVHFIEDEKGVEKTVWKIKKEKELMEVYDWVKTGRAQLQEKIDKAYEMHHVILMTSDDMHKWHDATSKLFDFTEAYRLEAEMEKIETKHLIWIIKNRATLWL